ncbi:MAG: CoB--CoM heterodisulfide reductase iron-sulfur subunit A family protein, partial [Deltaproteobacteria bacterium]|nr:CoB--CoM heterodisulfide reductase iron-sulfur subunit A family protein [Deltaproteobacteria bacterium]
KPVTQKALVVGGGPAGLAAAVSLAARKIDVTLVEKTNKIGGNLVNIQDDQIKEDIQKLVSDVENHSMVTIHLESEVAQSFGTPGQFVSRIRHQSGEEEPVMHGATILATGGQPSETQSYSREESDKITTVFELEKQIHDPGFLRTPVKTAVFIQCVDSREEPKNYCSRLCCLKSVKSAIKIADTHPDAQVYVFYRDIMTYGESEKFYTEARKKGVIFIPFSHDQKPQIEIDSGRVIVSGHDPILNETVSFDADIVALATGVHPNAIKTIQSVFGITITEDGFIKEADSKWRPVDTGKEGIFVCGLARNPLRADEAIKEGKAAAQRAIRILSKEAIISPRQVARVRHAICSLCEICIETCPYGARYVEPELGRIMVDQTSCQGCGTCAAACPNSATVMAQIEETGIMDAIEAAL